MICQVKENWPPDIADDLLRELRNLEASVLAEALGNLSEYAAMGCADIIVVAAPPRAQVLPHPPPAAKFTVTQIRRVVQRNVKAIGQLGATTQWHNITNRRPRAGRGRFSGRRTLMIAVTRDGVVIHQEQLTQEQKEYGWALVFREFLKQHPEALNPGGQEAAEPSTSSV